MSINKLIMQDDNKFIFEAAILGGTFELETGLLGHAWVAIDDKEKWDGKSAKIREFYIKHCSLS